MLEPGSAPNMGLGYHARAHVSWKKLGSSMVAQTYEDVFRPFKVFWVFLGPLNLDPSVAP
jgi:hypothetical protein